MAPPTNTASTPMVRYAGMDPNLSVRNGLNSAVGCASGSRPAPVAPDSTSVPSEGAEPGNQPVLPANMVGAWMYADTLVGQPKLGTGA